MLKIIFMNWSSCEGELSHRTLVSDTGAVKLAKVSSLTVVVQYYCNCDLTHDYTTNETGPLPLCTFSVMGLSMCSSIFSESSPVRSKSGIINELSGFPNYIQQCDAATPAPAGMVIPAMHIAFGL